jgi:polysaccharide biosynthesis/export protein
MKIIPLLSLLLAACAALPSAGPLQREMEQPQNTPHYALVTMTPALAQQLAQIRPPSFLGSFGNATPIPTQKIGIGDSLALTIYESAAGGLFSAPTGANILNGAKSIVLPNQTVDRDGKITIPYAGRVQANGLTPAQLAKRAEELLKSRAIEPQVVVTLVNNASMTATVLGDVTAGGKIPLNIRGERVLDVIASAGGLKAPEHQVLVRLARGAKTQTVPLRTLIAHPSENIFVRPHDTLLLLKEEQYFYAFGAVSKQGQFAFDQAELRLSDALGKAGGLNDTQADKGAMYLFRYETPQIMQVFAPPLATPPTPQGVPVIYKIDFADPEALFFMTQIPLRPRDVLFVSTAPSVEWGKFLSLIGTSLGTARAGVSAGVALTP